MAPGRPCEVVDVVLAVTLDAASAFGARLGRGPGRADDERLRYVDGHVVVPVVGVELGVCVEGMAVPAARGPLPHSGRFVDADLGKPLTHEKLVADQPGPG